MSSINKPIVDVIDNLIRESLDPDSYLANTKAQYIRAVAKKGVEEFMDKGWVGSPRGLRITVSEENYIDLPLDYKRYMRISEFTDCGKLVPIAVDSTIMTAKTYLLDNLDNILLDDRGVALLGTGDDGIDRECVNFDYSGCPSYRDTHYYNYGYDNYLNFNQYYNINDSFAPYVKFKEDVGNNRIQFSGRNLGEVVLEYVSDPLKSVGEVDELEINASFLDALEKWVYLEIINRRRSVPINEKMRAERDAKKTLLLAKLAKNTPNLNDLMSGTNLK